MREGAAKELLDNRLLNEIFDQLEDNAKERAISADPRDNETRAIAAMQVRAIRSVRLELESLANGPTNQFQADSVA